MHLNLFLTQEASTKNKPTQLNTLLLFERIDSIQLMFKADFENVDLNPLMTQVALN